MKSYLPYSLCLGLCLAILLPHRLTGWGFFAHTLIHHQAVYSLPPEMLVLYKPYQEFLTDHAIDADRRKFVYPAEAPRHYFDADLYDAHQWPCSWTEAQQRWPKNILDKNGILPWNTMQVYYQLVNAFRACDGQQILKLSADLGHYIADACVPLHASSNYDGQLTGQKGTHALWETYIPERLSPQFKLWVGKATFLPQPDATLWQLIRESAQAADTVLRVRRLLDAQFPRKLKRTYYLKNHKWIRGYSTAYLEAYEQAMHHMVERRMRLSISMVANFWYTAWVNAGQPDLHKCLNVHFNQADSLEWQRLQHIEWKERSEIISPFKE
ncbi:MAG: S1/P1 Nuclease [Thermoflavifilum sp.]|nr:S1/P1 Nuclease [Thermoflavifilum sp.]